MGYPVKNVTLVKGRPRDGLLASPPRRDTTSVCQPGDARRERLDVPDSTSFNLVYGDCLAPQ